MYYYFLLVLNLSSIQDMILRFKERKSGKQWSEFPSKVAVQLNDTHPTLAIPELMRLLMDEEGLGWDEAWDITTRCLALFSENFQFTASAAVVAFGLCGAQLLWDLISEKHVMEPGLLLIPITQYFLKHLRSGHKQ